MAQYINKADVIAEIEKVYNEVYKFFPPDVVEHVYNFKLDILINLDTLEVGDVNLGLNSFDATVCKNGNTYLKEIDRDAIGKSVEPFKDGDKVKVIIKAQKDCKFTEKQGKTKWKPSDKQMEALKEACDEHWDIDGLDPLYTLYQELKKLKEE